MKDFTKLNPIDYMSIPWKRRWYFLAAALLVIAGVTVYIWRKPVLYKSETTILIETNSLVDQISGGVGDRDRSAERVESVRQLIQSRVFLERLVEDFRLRFSDSVIPMEQAVERVRSQVIVGKKGSNGLSISFYSPDPAVARAVVLRMAEVLIDQNQSSQRDKAAGKDQFLEKELRQAENDLSITEQKIVQFKLAHPGELPEQNATTMNLITGLNTQRVTLDNAIERLSDQKKLLEFRLQEQQKIASLTQSMTSKQEAVVTTPVRQEPMPAMAAVLAAKKNRLSELMGKYSEKHPDVVTLTREVTELEQQLRMYIEAVKSQANPILTPLGQIGKGEEKPPDKAEPDIPRALDETQMAQIRFEINAISESLARREKEREEVSRQVAIQMKKLNLAPTFEQEYLGLNRDQQAKRELVSNLQRRKFDAGIATNAIADKSNEIYRVIDPANLPERPAVPDRLKIILIGLAASLGAGFAAAFAREAFESSFSSEEEVTAALKLPVLICIPQIPAKGNEI